MVEIDDEFEKKLEGVFAFTDDAEDAGYILPSGRMTHFGRGEKGQLLSCHESIRFVLGKNEQEAIMARQEFVASGAIRMVKGHPGAEMLSEPTDAQYSKLAEYFKAYHRLGLDDAHYRDCGVFLDMQDGLGEFDPQNSLYKKADRAAFKSFPTATNPAEILAEIRKFYGETR